jgi:hypothetical protein
MERNLTIFGGRITHRQSLALGECFSGGSMVSLFFLDLN